MPIKTTDSDYFPKQIINHFDIRRIYGKNLMQIMYTYQNQLKHFQNQYDNGQINQLYHQIQNLQHRNEQFLNRCAQFLPRTNRTAFLTQIKSIHFNQNHVYWQCVQLAAEQTSAVQKILKSYIQWDQPDFNFKISNHPKKLSIKSSLLPYLNQALQSETIFKNSIPSIKEE